MKRHVLLTLLLFLACSSKEVLAFDKSLLKQKGDAGAESLVSKWVVPDLISEDGYIDESKVPKDSEYFKMVILGNKILNETSRYIGPQAKDPKMRYSGNNLACSSCHAAGGTRQYQSAFIGTYAKFPEYNARSDAIVTLENRINGCMQRSMNGKPIPIDSKEMKAMLTYMHYLSLNLPVKGRVKGGGLVKIALIDRAADPIKGAVIFKERCASCHQENGLGYKNPDSDGPYYIFPPLWGKDSYNTGAGMYRELKAAAYIKGTMPSGEANLSDEEAFDVAAFINSQRRPSKKGLDKDFPDRRVKPVDAVVGPYIDNFSQKQHRFGPYKDMMK